MFQKNYGQYTDVINSNRPSESISAFSVGKKVLQLEGGIGYISDKHSLLGYKSTGQFADLSLRYGIFFEQFEAMVDINYQNDKFVDLNTSTNRSGVKNATIGGKYLVYDPFKNYEEKVNLYSWKANHKFKWRQLIPAVAIYAGANLNFSTPYLPKNETTSPVSPKVMLVTQNVFANGFILLTNVFFDKISTPRENMGYTLTLTKGFNDKWSGFFENKAIVSDLYSDGIFSAGAAYLISEDLQVDASISKNFKATPDLVYGSIGISWRNDFNYKEVKIKKPKNQSKTDKKMEKKKEKDKKRRDAKLEETP